MPNLLGVGSSDGAVQPRLRGGRRQLDYPDNDEAEASSKTNMHVPVGQIPSIRNRVVVLLILAASVLGFFAGRSSSSVGYSSTNSITIRSTAADSTVDYSPTNSNTSRSTATDTDSKRVETGKPYQDRGKLKWRKGTADWAKPCVFLPDDTAPTPVLFIVMGRSGSSATWDTMSALTGERSIAREVPGQDDKQIKNFFQNLEEDPMAHTNWTLHQLCHNQRYSTSRQNVGIAGFQWKPYQETFLRHKYSLSGLQAIVDHNARGKKPQIKVVFSFRNFLDVVISQYKHRGKKLPPHCAVGNEKCIRQHTKMGHSAELPTGKELLQEIYIRSKAWRDTLDLLDKLNVKYISTSYGDLYDFSSDSASKKSAESWMKIFRYLGKGPSKNLTAEDVVNSFSIAPTHKGRKETVANYNEVRNTLMGGAFEYLLDE